MKKTGLFFLVFLLQFCVLTPAYSAPPPSDIWNPTLGDIAISADSPTGRVSILGRNPSGDVTNYHRIRDYQILPEDGGDPYATAARLGFIDPLSGWASSVYAASSWGYSANPHYVGSDIWLDFYSVSIDPAMPSAETPVRLTSFSGSPVGSGSGGGSGGGTGGGDPGTGGGDPSTGGSSSPIDALFSSINISDLDSNIVSLFCGFVLIMLIMFAFKLLRSSLLRVVSESYARDSDDGVAVSWNSFDDKDEFRRRDAGSIFS